MNHIDTHDEELADCPTHGDDQVVTAIHTGPGFCTPMTMLTLACGCQLIEGDEIED